MPRQTGSGQRFGMMLVYFTLLVGLVCLLTSLSHLLSSSDSHGVSTKISERSTEVNEATRLDFLDARSHSLSLSGIAKRALVARDDTDSEEDSESSHDEKMPDAPQTTPAEQRKDSKSSSDVKMPDAPQATPAGQGNIPSSNAPNPSGQPEWANPFGPYQRYPPSAHGVPYELQRAPPGSIPQDQQQSSWRSMENPPQIPHYPLPAELSRPSRSSEDRYKATRPPSEIFGLAGHEITPYGFNDPRSQAAGSELQSIADSAGPFVYHPQPLMVGYPPWCPAAPEPQVGLPEVQPMPVYPPPQGRGVPLMVAGVPPRAQPAPAYPPPQGRGVPPMVPGAPPRYQPISAYPPPQGRGVPPMVAGAPPGSQPIPAYPPPQGRGVPLMVPGAPPSAHPMPAPPPPQAQGVPPMIAGAPPGAQPIPAHPPPQAHGMPPLAAGPAPQAVAVGQSVPAVPPASWVKLVLITWKTYVPLMYADIQAANQAMAQLKRPNASPGGWQKDNNMWYNTVEVGVIRTNPLKAQKWRRVLWVQSNPPGVSLRPVQAALSRLRLPNTNQQIHIQSLLDAPKVLWMQQHQWSLRVGPQKFPPTYARHLLAYDQVNGIILVCESHGMSHIANEQPEIKQFKAEHGISGRIDDWLPDAGDVTVLISHDWERLRRDRHRQGSPLHQPFSGLIPVHYIVFQSVDLGKNSLGIIRALLESACGKNRNTLLAGPQGAVFRIGDYQYGAILGLPEFEWLVRLLVDRKTQFGRKVLSEVRIFIGDGDDGDKPSFIWSLRNSADVSLNDAAMRHYMFMKTALKKRIVDQQAFDQDPPMMSIYKDEQKFIRDGGQAFDGIPLPGID